MWYGQSCRGVVNTESRNRLDYANSVLIGTSGRNINKLQCVQNCLARVVLQDYYNSPTSLLSEIHWLPVNRELISKLLHLCTSHLLLVSPLIYLRYKYLIGLSGPSAKLIRICYLCHAATAVSDKEGFSTAPLKSGITYHFRSDSPCEFITMDGLTGNLSK